MGFTEAGGVKTSKRKASDEGDKKAKKSAKDPNAPKKPVGGAWSCFMEATRPEAVAKAPGGSKDFAFISKYIKEKWDSLSDADEKPYEDKYATKKADYDKAMEASK